jgi:hypothetical protein
MSIARRHFLDPDPRPGTVGLPPRRRLGSGEGARPDQLPGQDLDQRRFPAFHGNLHFAGSFCIAERPVRVYRVRSGPDQLLGTERSEEDGFWQVSIGNLLGSGSYYAEAPTFGSASLGIRCLTSRSKVVTVH